MNEYDIFIGHSIYPDPEDIFKLSLKSVEDIKDDCIFVIDTNALLVPYTASAESLDQIRRVYAALKQAQRLVIPGQVAREFAKQRPVKLQELFQQLNNEKSRVHEPDIRGYPLLDNVQEYKDALDIEDKINDLIKEYKGKISELAARIKNWTWNDPVSSTYNELFSSDVIFEPQYDEQTVGQDLERRYTHRIPPGYKDKGKRDDGIGDLLIWYTILEIAKTRNKDVIFVSGDEKPDWFHRSMEQPLYPRFELVSEFFRETGGRAFHLIRFTEFLNLRGVDKKIVEEIEEAQDFGSWLDEIVTAFEALGGKATLSQVYDFIENTTARTLQRTWQATVRYTIQIHSSDSDTYKGGPDLFRRLGRGYWALRDFLEDEDQEE